MLVEDLPIEVHANVGFHVFRTVIEDLVGVEALGHRPRTDNVIHDSFAQCLRHLVQLHEFAHVVQHVVVLGGGRRHLLDDRCHVTEYRGV